MALPFQYAIRNLVRSPVRTIQMIIGSAVVMVLLMGAVAFQQGMQRSMRSSGDAQNVIILGAGSEESIQRSEIAAASAAIVAANAEGLAQFMGQAAVSPEVYYMGLVNSDGFERQAVLRGITEQALWVHQQVRLRDGHLPRPGEILVGARAAAYLDLPETALATGALIRFEEQDYRICGHFSAGDSVLESELWLDLGDLMSSSGRESLSSLALRLGRPDAFEEVDLFCAQRLDLELVALSEVDYYGSLNDFYQPLILMAWLTTGLIALGALFGGLNTFYAAISQRIRELAALQAIGFRRWMLIWSLIQESLLTTSCGLIGACVVVFGLLDGLNVGTSSGVFSLQFHTAEMSVGLISCCLLAILGLLAPAWHCLHPPLTSALRSQS